MKYHHYHLGIAGFLLCVLLAVWMTGRLTEGLESMDSSGTTLDVSMSPTTTHILDNSGTPLQKLDMNMNTQYHDTVETIQKNSPVTSMVLQNGVLTSVPWTDVSTNVGYNAPDFFKYGAQSYVPTYADSVYLGGGGGAKVPTPPS